MIRPVLFLLSLLAAASAAAQAPVTVIAVPPLATPSKGDKANEDLAKAWQATQQIVTDLRGTSELMPLTPNHKDYYSYPEVTAPSFPKWRAAGAKALVTGFVQTRPDGRLTFGCYVYDVPSGRELARKGFVVAANDLRRAAHRCSGLAYQSITGAPGMFDTRIAYVAETGSGPNPVRRIAIMDSDGFNHDYATMGETMVLSPRLSPRARSVAFVSFSGGSPHIRILDLETRKTNSLITGDPISFSPRFSPDGQKIAFTMVQGNNSDIYVADAAGGPPVRLTTEPGIDTAPAFSPDGRQILFESDRSGSQQLYVMNADGTGQRRISFGASAYAAPAWSPDGEWIAFVARQSGSRRIGIMKADGRDERILTYGVTDDSPSWAPSSREILFERMDGGRPSLLRIALGEREPRAMTIPQPGSDPDWSGVIE
jgi:TolB protein